MPVPLLFIAVQKTMVAQQLVSSCQVPTQSRCASVGGARNAACALAKLAGKRIAGLGSAKNVSSFVGVSLASVRPTIYVFCVPV